MYTSVLLLHETDPLMIDGEIPSSIELSRNSIVIGRGSALKPVDIVLSAKKDSKEIISRQHAEIVRNTNGEFEIRDLKALNGLFVNGVRVLSKVLRHHDVIQFGGLCDVPVGKTLEASDLCVKYKFMLNHILNSGKKRTNEDVSSSPVKSPKVDSALRAHSPLNGRMQSAYPKLQLNSKSPTVSPEKKPQPNKSSDSLSLTGSLKHQVSSDSVNSLVDDSTKEITCSTEKGNVSAPQASLPLNMLRDALNCTLCNNILLDAVVLQCSHGYCRCCIEKHIRQFKSTCPVCSDKPSSPLDNKLRSTGYLNIAYNRSAHLDLLVNHFLEVSSAEVQRLFSERDSADRQSLTKMGMDPDISRSSDGIDGTGEDQKDNAERSDNEDENEEDASSDAEDDNDDYDNAGSGNDDSDEGEHSSDEGDSENDDD